MKKLGIFKKLIRENHVDGCNGKVLTHAWISNVNADISLMSIQNSFIMFNVQNVKRYICAMDILN